MTTNQSAFRIAFVNPGGFPANSRMEKSQRIVQYAKTIEADSLGFVETNMNWPKIGAGCRLHKWFHGVWRRCSFNIAHHADYPPKQVPGAMAKQWGGVAQCSIDEALSRIHSTSVDLTGLGRWAWTQYQGKEGYGLVCCLLIDAMKKQNMPDQFITNKKPFSIQRVSPATHAMPFGKI
jgi:hypothetical protein